MDQDRDMTEEEARMYCDWEDAQGPEYWREKEAWERRVLQEMNEAYGCDTEKIQV